MKINLNFYISSINRLPVDIISIVKSINTNNIIDYKFDRTPIEDVVTRCKVKYHYDYGLKDYTKETDWLYAGGENGIISTSIGVDDQDNPIPNNIIITLVKLKAILKL